MGRHAKESEDPLTLALAPPPNETAEEREVRLQQEAEAKRVSDAIDDALKAERIALKKRKIMKMLLLGQSESGKTTTLKNMQLTYAPKAWALEKASWKAVIQLNLIRSINTILDTLAAHLTSSPPSPSPSSLMPRRVKSPPPAASPEDPFASSVPAIDIPSEKKSYLLKLSLRLGPLRQVEKDLKARLGDGSEELTEADVMHQSLSLATSPFDDPPSPSLTSPTSPPRISPRPSRDVVVRSHLAWKLRERQRKKKEKPGSRPSSSDSNESDTTTEVLAGCAEDMGALWADETVQEVMHATKLIDSLGDSAEHFLDRIGDIAKRSYVPTDLDVLRARIRTLGVQEYNLVFETRNERDAWKEWAVYDVGGARSQRRAWLPYFSDVHAILFLAPISVFDERLSEDRKVNRLQDSFELWEAIAKSDLLKACTIILFMNKCDLLKRKLERGVPVKKYLPSYGDRDNDFPTFSRYLKTKFKDILIQKSPERQFYGHMTSVIDAEATAATLRSVRDGILQGHMKDAAMV